MLFVTLSISLISAILGTIVSTECNPGSLGKFYVRMGYENGTVSNYPAILDLETSHPILCGSFRSHESINYTHDFKWSTNFSIADDISFDFRDKFLDPKVVDAEPIFKLPAGPQSALMQRIPNFLMTPVSRIAGMIVFNPSNPHDYAMDGQLYYTSAVSRDKWDTKVLIHISDAAGTVAASPDHSETLHPTICSLDTTNLFVEIPKRVLAQLEEIFAQLGVKIHARDEVNTVKTTILKIPNGEIFNQLPHIQMLVETGNGDLTSFAVLEPRDYLLPNRHNPGYYLLLLRPHLWDGGCTVGPHILNRVVIHFDAQNRQIGFGDPRVN